MKKLMVDVYSASYSKSVELCLMWLSQLHNVEDIQPLKLVVSTVSFQSDSYWFESQLGLDTVFSTHFPGFIHACQANG